MIVTMEWLERYLAIKEEMKDIKARLDAIDGWKSPRLSDNPSHASSNEGLNPIIIRGRSYIGSTWRSSPRGKKQFLR